LNVRSFISGNADLRPGRWNGQLLDARPKDLVARCPAFTIEITEAFAATAATQVKVGSPYVG
jgi:hypothetical protein